MKILVTGGAGFLGSHVSDALSAAGHEVVIYDRRNSKYLREDQKIIIGELSELEKLEEVVKQVEVVFHLAGVADIGVCASNPIDTVNVNILGTVNLLEICKNNNIKRFVFASSAYVFSQYGYFYKVSKKACEEYIENYNILYGLEYTILRYGSVYGLRADEGNSIRKILKSALNDNKIVYNGTGEETREYINVLDVARYSVEILDEKFKNISVIMTGNYSLKYKDLLEMVNEILGGNIEIEYKENKNKAHYKITPYSFIPRSSMKMTSNLFVDFGQGLLTCIEEITQENSKEV